MTSNVKTDNEQADDRQSSILTFSKRVKEFRKLRGLTQANLAEAAEVDRKTISRIENSAYSPSLTSLFAIAKALEVDPKELL